MNLAFMAKLGWQLVTEHKSLWVKVIAKKVIGEISLKKLNKKQGSSNTWRGITTVAEILRKGARIRVYNGRDTLFWRDLWLGEFL